MTKFKRTLSSLSVQYNISKKEGRKDMNKESIDILKKFTTVNTSFVISNDVIGVLSTDKATCMFYEPSNLDEFETKAHIYNVTEFLNVVETLGDQTDLKVNENTIDIINGKKKLKYVLSSKSVKEIPTTIESKFEEFPKDVVFTLNRDDLGQITKIAGLLGLDKVTLSVDENGVCITTNETGNDSSDDFRIELDGTGIEGASISLSIDELIKLIPGTYDVIASSAGMSKFESKTLDTLRYYIANKIN